MEERGEVQEASSEFIDKIIIKDMSIYGQKC